MKLLSWLWSDSGGKSHLLRGLGADARASVEQQEAGEFPKPLSPDAVGQRVSGVPNRRECKAP